MHLWRVFRRKLAPLLELQADSDFFALLRQLLVVSGVHLETNRAWVRWLFRLYQLLYPAQCLIWLYRTWLVAFVEQNKTLSLSLLCGLFALTTISVRCWLILLSYGRLATVRRYINSQRFLRNDPTARQIRQRAFRANNTLTLGLVAYGLVNFLVYELFGLQSHDIFRMPDYLWRTNATLAWTLHVAVHPMTLTGLAAFVASFLNMHTLLTALQAEFRLVEYAFGGLLSRRVGESPDVDGLWCELNRELGCCVREHCEVVRHIREVNRVFSFSIIVQYYTALLSLAIDTFFVSYHGFDFVTVMVVTFSTLLVFEWYHSCKLVEDLQATLFPSTANGRRLTNTSPITIAALLAISARLHHRLGLGFIAAGSTVALLLLLLLM
uniref:Odorant receptor n=1 Tax=Anopheles farauti TaxID=69004 RepID=A0A182QR19_9DIPT